jgi:acyl-coenzyme A synthetase/AMP-(fatty) acid ligase
LNTLVYKYNFDNETDLLDDLAEKSGKIIAQTIEMGCNFPFSKIVRECEVQNPQNLLNCMFVWVSGKISSNFSQSHGISKFLCLCDGKRIGLESWILNHSLSPLLFLRECSKGSGLPRNPHSFRVLDVQEEDWNSMVLPEKHQTFQKFCQTILFDGVTLKDETKEQTSSRIMARVGAFFKRVKDRSIFATYANRSVLQVVYLHATAFFGFCILPVDVEYNSEVVKFRLFDCNCNVLLVDKNHLQKSVGKFDKYMMDSVVNWLRFSLPISKHDDLSYILYTSGTTGRPKGVCLSQGATANYFSWLWSANINSPPDDRFLFQTSVSFDIQFTMNFWCHQVIIVKEGAEKDVEYMKLLMEFEAVSCVFFVPSHFQMMISSVKDTKTFPSVRLVMLGGEALSLKLFFETQSVMPKSLIQNLYGPSETYAVTFLSCKSEILHGKNLFAPIGIGEPIPNCWASVSSLGLRIHGKNTGLGYMNLYTQTRNRFLYDVLSNDGLRKTYETGDTVQWSENGKLQFLGRKDDQTKINGKRVELGNVENTIMKCSNAKACALVVKKTQNKTLQLVVFLVSPVETNEGKIRNELRKYLQGHEIPQKFVFVDEIPLTQSGKKNKILLQRMAEELKLKKGIVKHPTRSPSETLIQACFKEVMGEGMSAEASIWEQGVTSLNAIQLENRVFERSGIRLGISGLLKDGSLEAMGRTLDLKKHLSVGPSTPGRQMEFIRMNRISTGSPVGIVLFISSFGLLAETAMGFINILKSNGFDVYVLEFAGIQKNPEEICKIFEEKLEEMEQIKIRAIAGHSAGGVYALELGKILEARGLQFRVCLFDSYVPYPTNFNTEEILRFVMEPFCKIKNLASAKLVPKDYLDVVFRDLLCGVGFDSSKSEALVEIYKSDGMHEMISKLFSWKIEGRLRSLCLFVRASDADPTLQNWKKNFQHPIILKEVEESHYQMIERSGAELVSFLKN